MSRPQKSRGHKAGKPQGGGKHRKGGGDAPQHATAPYNFVPLSPHVFVPDWAEAVSHDRPFSDGLSGTLGLRIVADSPILIGGERRPARDAANAVEFLRLPDGRAVIPGSSLKGMLRSLVEIAAFGRMRFVDDRRFSLRDLSGRTRDAYQHKMTETLRPGTFRSRPRAGLLRYSAEHRCWQIQPCAYARVEQRDLFQRCANGRALWRGNERLGARDKHERWRKAGLPEYDLPFTAGPEQDHPHQKGSIRLRYRKADLSGSQQRGRLVFTGQPNPRKHLEFLFFDEQDRRLNVPAAVWRGFVQVHEESDAWAYWKRRHEAGEAVPVFYLLDGQGQVESLGLALMYKLACTHSVHDVIRHTSAEHLADRGDDLAALLFGWADPQGEHSLRARVQCRMAVAQGAPQAAEDRWVVLGTPKPSFVPNYLEQPGMREGRLPDRAEYRTWMNDDARLRGWKRYPAREQLADRRTPDASQQKVASRLRPLPAGTVFDGEIAFHNLRPAELGALLWVLRWGGNARLRHSLGMGRPLGYGQLRIEIDPQRTKLLPNRPGAAPPSPDDCMQAFTALMEGWHRSCVGGSWQDSPQITALLAMADPDKARAVPGGLRYIGEGLPGNGMPNAHGKARSEGLVLPPYPGTALPGPAAAANGGPPAPPDCQGPAPHPWLAEQLARLADPPHNIRNPQHALLSRVLLDAWQAIEDPAVRGAVLENILAILQANGWDDPASASRKGRQVLEAFRQAATT